MGYSDIEEKRRASREYYQLKYAQSAKFRKKEAERKAEWYDENDIREKRLKKRIKARKEKK